MTACKSSTRQARIDFYADNSIGWTSRPKHGSESFVRKGKFKKASNMNWVDLLLTHSSIRLPILTAVL
jgi:hypothetical protein